MLVGHRWMRDFDFQGWKCMPLPFGGVESYQWCVGCDCRIGDLELYRSRLPTDRFLEISLDMLARSKGYEPIKAGTFEAFKLARRRRSSSD